MTHWQEVLLPFDGIPAYGSMDHQSIISQPLKSDGFFSPYSRHRCLPITNTATQPCFRFIGCFQSFNGGMCANLLPRFFCFSKVMKMAWPKCWIFCSIIWNEAEIAGGITRAWATLRWHVLTIDLMKMPEKSTASQRLNAFSQHSIRQSWAGIQN